MWRLYFIAKQIEKRKNYNAKTVQNCAKKSLIDILGKSPILRAFTWPTMTAPNNVTITINCYNNNIEKITWNTHSRKMPFLPLKLCIIIANLIRIWWRYYCVPLSYCVTTSCAVKDAIYFWRQFREAGTKKAKNCKKTLKNTVLMTSQWRHRLFS